MQVAPKIRVINKVIAHSCKLAVCPDQNTPDAIIPGVHGSQRKYIRKPRIRLIRIPWKKIIFCSQLFQLIIFSF